MPVKTRKPSSRNIRETHRDRFKSHSLNRRHFSSIKSNAKDNDTVASIKRGIVVSHSNALRSAGVYATQDRESQLLSDTVSFTPNAQAFMTNDAYVFKWPDGHLYSPDYISERFSNLLKKHNLPHIRFHELRHSCASMLLSMGWSLKDIQEWLGHSDIKMTTNLYSHLDVARKHTIADSLAGKFKA